MLQRFPMPRAMVWCDAMHPLLPVPPSHPPRWQQCIPKRRVIPVLSLPSPWNPGVHWCTVQWPNVSEGCSSSLPTARGTCDNHNFVTQKGQGRTVLLEGLDQRHPQCFVWKGRTNFILLLIKEGNSSVLKLRIKERHKQGNIYTTVCMKQDAFSILYNCFSCSHFKHCLKRHRMYLEIARIHKYANLKYTLVTDFPYKGFYKAWWPRGLPLSTLPVVFSSLFIN